MTPALPGDLGRDTAVRIGAATVLYCGYARAFRPPAARGRHSAVAWALGMAGPVFAVGRVLRGRSVRVVPPSGGGARVGFLLHVVAGVVVEEAVWRGPLTRGPTRRRLVLALVSACGFVSVHLHRDGTASGRVHVPNTVGWTLAALVEGRLRVAIASHTAYNVLAHTLRDGSEAS